MPFPSNHLVGILAFLALLAAWQGGFGRTVETHLPNGITYLSPSFFSQKALLHYLCIWVLYTQELLPGRRTFGRRTLYSMLGRHHLCFAIYRQLVGSCTYATPAYLA